MVIFLLLKNIAIMVSFLINDIISEDKQSYQEFQNKYMISTNFIEYYDIVGAVPRRWKNLISENRRLHDITNDIVDRLKSDKVTKQINTHCIAKVRSEVFNRHMTYSLNPLYL